MNEASQTLVGSHDFASFGKPPQGNTTVRQIMHANWLTKNSKYLTFSITANAFLYRMVRTIVGTLVQVGLGRLASDDIQTILEARDLTQSASPAPAHGLCLVSVAYPEGL
jgi:tRNA pseudouridine38-40 synthase